ncbi:MAG: biotin--[acetyl-CoA-carboxylase] ligase [Cellulosilyticaceae bacterium]
MRIKNLNTKYMGKELEYHKTIDSTNIRAKEWAKEGAKEGSLVIAEYQSAGKGRLGRTWLSPKGEGIWMSLILKPLLEISKIPQLTIVAGLCMSQAIENVTGLKVEIKWPNDIIINNKKIAGILTELSASSNNINSVVVGIGVNVNNQEIDSTIPYATSLTLEGNKVYEKEEIIKEFLDLFEVNYEQYIKEKSIAFLLEEYRMRCVNLNKEVKIISNKKEYIAYVQNINDEGSLEVRRLDGNIETIFTGEVSVRGLYGYI